LYPARQKPSPKRVWRGLQWRQLEQFCTKRKKLEDYYQNRNTDFFDKNNHFSMNGMKTLCGDIKEADNEVVDMAQKSIK
jgi:hypothetical protein